MDLIPDCKTMNISIRKTISARPWLLVVAAFVLLVTMWTGLIVVAVRHAPQSVPLSPVVHDQH